MRWSVTLKSQSGEIQGQENKMQDTIEISYQRNLRHIQWGLEFKMEMSKGGKLKRWTKELMKHVWDAEEDGQG